MKPLILFLGFAIGCSGCGKSTRDVELQEQVTAYFQALVQGRQQVAIEQMDPRFFPSAEVKKEAIRLLKESTGSFVYHGITNQQPFGYFKGSNSVHCFVPYVSDATIKTQRAVVKSYLLATRYDGTKTWYFVDIGSKSQSLLSKYYPNLPQELPRASLESKQ
jgi:hypothetical protein